MLRSAKVWLARLVAAAILAALVVPAPTLAAGSPLDPSFGDDGIELTPASDYLEEGEIHALARDAKGRILAVGENGVEEFALLRYRPNGSLDPALRGENPLPGGGLVTTGMFGDAVARALVLQSDGKIVVAGSNSQGSGFGSDGAFALVRYLPDGSRDSGFGHDGRVLHGLPGIENGGAFAVGLQSNGRIVVGGFHEVSGGWTEGLLVGFKSNGAIDRSFGRAGEVSLVAGRKGYVWITSLRVLPNDRILLAGEWNGHFLVARLLPNGRPDPSFGGDGRVVTDVGGACNCAYATSLTQSQGRILVAGSSVEDGQRLGVVISYRRNGTIDKSFGQNGVMRIRRGGELALKAIASGKDGRLVAAGYYYPLGRSGPQAVALRIRPNGLLDSSFGHSGLFVHNFPRGSVASAALTQPNGRVLIAGRASVKPPEFSESESALDGAQFMLMRLLPRA